MTLLPFPDRPALDDVHEGYIFDGTKWICIPTDGGGGGALPNIPPYTLFGNNMATTGQPVALNGAEATALLTTFDATDQGVVPAPGAADPGTNVLLSSGAWGNAAAVIGTFPAAQPGLVPAPATGAGNNQVLSADGTWRVPLARPGLPIVGTDYVATPNTDIVHLGNLTGPTTFTVPASTLAVTGQQFRVTIRETLFPVTFQSPPGDSYNFWMYDRATLQYSNYLTTFTILPPATTEILFINQGGGGGWWVINQGLPKQITSTAPAVELLLPGVVPNPPAGTISNAALQADMTWRVPGTNFVDVSTSYNILPTDDVIMLRNTTVPVTLTMPSLFPAGKIIRVLLWTGISDSVTISASSLWSFGGPLGWNGGGPITLPAPVQTTELMFIARAGNQWVMVNQGPPITGISGAPVQPGLLPGPPAGTIANAALQADMTWQVPQTNYRQINNASYTVLPTDDIILMYFSPNTSNTNSTLTLPAGSAVPDGKRLRVMVQFGTGGTGNNTPTGCSLTISPSGSNFLTPLPLILGNIAGSAFTITPTLQGPIDPIFYQLLLVSVAGNYWYMVNEATPVPYTLGGFPGVLPGLMPGPPVGTPATAVLHADMTWY